MMGPRSLGGSLERHPACPHAQKHAKAAQLVSAETFGTKHSRTKEIRCDANLFGARGDIWWSKHSQHDELHEYEPTAALVERTDVC